MTEISTGRLADPFVSVTSGSIENSAGGYSWNLPKKAINPYLDPAEVAPVFCAFKPDHSVRYR